jgi:hypothetical protein
MFLSNRELGISAADWEGSVDRSYFLGVDPWPQAALLSQLSRRQIS